MPRVVFTSHLERYVTCPPAEVSGATVREVLGAVFAGNEQLRGYVLDEQGALRRHMNIFIDGERIRDRTTLSDPAEPNSQIYVLQALSGG